MQSKILYSNAICHNCKRTFMAQVTVRYPISGVVVGCPCCGHEEYFSASLSAQNNSGATEYNSERDGFVGAEIA